MKRVFLLLAAALVTVVSCEQTPNEDKPIDQPIENPILSTTTGSEMSISFIGETCDVEYTLTGVSEGKKPEASATEAWVKNVTVGKSITFEVEQNTTTSARSATLKVWYADKSFEVALNQEAGLVPTVEFEAKCLNGQTYESNLYNYFVILSEKGVTGWSEVAVGEVYYRFDVYGHEPAGNPVILPQGIYTFSSSDNVLGTFAYGYSVRMTYIAGEGYKDDYMIGGAMKVENNRIEAIVEFASGEVHRVVYEGSLELKYNDIPRPDYFSSLTEDYTFNHPDGQIYFAYYGDLTGRGFGNWVVSMMLPDETQGDCFRIDLGVTSTSFDESALLGEYTCVVGEDNLAPGTFCGGDVNLADGTYTGSWYFIIKDGYYGGSGGAPLVDGKITISKVDGKYQVVYDCLDDRGNKIQGTFVCSRAYSQDQTQQQ